ASPAIVAAVSEWSLRAHRGLISLPFRIIRIIEHWIIPAATRRCRSQAAIAIDRTRPSRRAPRRSQSARLRGRGLPGVHELHAGAEWDLHEVRYVREHHGVLVREVLVGKIARALEHSRPCFWVCI